LVPTDRQLRGEGTGASSSRIGLLLTCAVAAHPAIQSKEQSAVARLDQYRSGIASWRFFDPVGPIVVCEGSGFAEDRFRAAVDRGGESPRFEYLSFATSDASAARGKGCAELELIANALSAGDALSGVDVVLKATGRLAVLNGETLVRRLLDREPLPSVLVNLHNRLSYADSRVFVFSRPFFFDYLYPLREEIDEAAGDGAVWLEHVLARATLRHAADSGTWDLLPVAPRVRGVSGTTGERYRDSPPAQLARAARRWIKAKALGKAPNEPQRVGRPGGG